MNRRFNGLMFLFGLIGGTIGFFIGEIVLKRLLYVLPHSVTVGIYFGQLAFFIGLMCLIAEVVSPKINGLNWRNTYSKYSFAFLVPCTLIAALLLGALLQFIYSVDFSKGEKIKDVVMLVDVSGSMAQTDPQNKRFEAVKNLIGNMTDDNRIGIFVFSDDVSNIQPMDGISNELKENVPAKFSAYNVPSGRTNIKGALDSAIGHINQNAVQGKASMVILLSDGGDNYGLGDVFNETIGPFRKQHIPIFTVGMNGSDVALLSRLSNNTAGKYYSVDEAGELSEVFTKIYRERDMRTLTGERNGWASSSLIYAIMRVLFWTIIGGFIGLAVGLVFDNRYAAKGLAIGGITAGLIAGVIMEAGFSAAPQAGPVIRLAADIVISCVFTLFALIIPQGRYTAERGGSFRIGGYNNSPGPFGTGRNEEKRSF